MGILDEPVDPNRPGDLFRRDPWSALLETSQKKRVEPFTGH